MNGQIYIQSVIDHVPYALPLRDHIAMELRSHIAERTEHGQPLDEVVRQLGDPLTLAESYLAAVPLENAPIERRIAAKLIDAALALGVVGSITLVAWALVPREAAVFLPVLAILTCVLGFVTYTAMAEYRYGRTFGKRLMGIHVVRESGARIGLGQAVVRQLPFFAQFFWIDALFALFTDRRQRAFELLTKTRAVALLLGVVISA
jgi:uncharacterized RDD family membrane protein YckC